MSGPSEIYCLKCRSLEPVVDLHLSDTGFKSKKSKTEMHRSTWLGKCKVCGKDVRQFAKKATEEPAKPALEEKKIKQ